MKRVWLVALLTMLSIFNTICAQELRPMRKGEKWGFENRDGVQVIPAFYDEVRNFKEGFAAVRQGELWGFVDENGEKITECIYQEVRDFCNGMAAVKQVKLRGTGNKFKYKKIRNSWNYVNGNGEEMIGNGLKTYIQIAEDFGFNGLAKVQYSTGHKSARETMRSVGIIYTVIPIYAPIGVPLWCAGSFKTYAYTDKSGNIIIGDDYKELNEIEEGIYWVKDAYNNKFYMDIMGTQYSNLEEAQFAVNKMKESNPNAIEDYILATTERLNAEKNGSSETYLATETNTNNDRVGGGLLAQQVVTSTSTVTSPTREDYISDWQTSLSSSSRSVGTYNSTGAYTNTGFYNNATSTAPVTLTSYVDVNIPTTLARSENTFVVIIANEEYRRESKVDYALNDGSTFKKYCESTLGIPGSNIRYVQNATLNDIRIELNWMSNVGKAYNGDAKFIFYYAGHGIPDEATQSAYLLPVDGYGADATTAYKLDDLYAQLAGCPSKATIVLLDACFSGAKRDGEMLAAARGVAIKAKKSIPTGNLIVFSAAQGDETAYPNVGSEHGMFTYFLLQKLKDTQGDITLGELSNYVIQQVKRRSIVENSKTQTPEIIVSPSLKDSWGNLKLIE